MEKILSATTAATNTAKTGKFFRSSPRPPWPIVFDLLRAPSNQPKEIHK
jgi:hypothetical protein